MDAKTSQVPEGAIGNPHPVQGAYGTTWTLAGYDEKGFQCLGDECPWCAAQALIINEWGAAECLTCAWREAEAPDRRPAGTLEEMLREFHRGKVIHRGLMPRQPTFSIPGEVRSLRWALLREELRELREADQAQDIVKLADAIGDVIYVLAGTAVVHGIPLDDVLAEIHRSNMTKVNSPSEAKLVKGPGYEPPDLERVLGAGEVCPGA